MNRSVLFAALLTILSQISCYVFDNDSRMDLGGSWEFRRAGSFEWHRAEVPGCVHTDLLANGLIPDPYFGSNELRLQDIEKDGWEYRKTFRLSRAKLARGHFELVFEGLDTYAAVYLNDSLLFEADNMFRRWSVPCGEALQEGPNELLVRFRPPVRSVEAAWNSLACELPGGPRVLTRKAAYHYGWDWAPRFVTCGIWRPVYMRAWDGARILDFVVTEESVSSRRAEFTAGFDVEADSTGRAALTVLVDGSPAARVDVELRPGGNRFVVPFSVEDPELWWTNGLGEPHLYDVRGELRLGSFTVDRAKRRIGVRTIELVDEPDSAGRTFFLELNGVPLYVKGANWVPLDGFLGRVTPERYEYFVSSAADAYMNALRVWGGGVYEDEVFYDLCDEYGILVWQDFMFACAMYPGDPAFLAGVEREAIDAVKRLRGHPCIALWCGNNEIDEAWRNWGWQRQYGIQPADSVRLWSDYERLFHEVLPEIVARHDPGRPYVPSSPRFGRADPRSLTEGDCHYWGVWHDGEPFEAFLEKVPRFMSEFGFQSFPAFESVKRFTASRDRRIDSEAMLVHQKHTRGNEIVRAYMERSYRVPDDFRDFTYVSQLLQAEGVRMGIEAERRAKPYCMGSLFWQLGDCWPSVSWSCIDYFGVPKALYYFAREAFATVLVSPVVENGRIGIWIVSDLDEPVSGSLELEVLDFAGASLWARRVDVRLPAFSSERYFDDAVENVLRGRDPRTVLLAAELSNETGRIARNVLYFVPPKALELPPVEYVSCVIPEPLREHAGRSAGPETGAAQVRYCIGSQGRRLWIEIESDVLVKNLWLEVEGASGYFMENFFDIVPGERVTVDLATDRRAGAAPPFLRLMSLADTYRRTED